MLHRDSLFNFLFRQIHTLLILACLGLFSGCATIMNDDYVSVPVQTNPGNATIKVAGREYASPADVLVPRGKEEIPLTIEKEGFKTIHVTFKKTIDGWVWGNFIVFPISIAIGFPIDFATGKAFDVKPDALHFQLESLAKNIPPKSRQAGDKPMQLQVFTSLTNHSWFPLRSEDMIAAATDKALSELSRLGNFRFIRKAQNTEPIPPDSGAIYLDVDLIENIEVVKLRITVQTPAGQSLITSVSDSLADQDREGIYRTFEKVGKLAAGNIFQLIVDTKKRSTTSAR